MMHPCEYPPGCEIEAPAVPGKRLCHPHLIVLGAMFASLNEPEPFDDREIAWANTQLNR